MLAAAAHLWFLDKRSEKCVFSHDDEHNLRGMLPRKFWGKLSYMVPDEPTQESAAKF